MFADTEGVFAVNCGPRALSASSQGPGRGTEAKWGPGPSCRQPRRPPLERGADMRPGPQLPALVAALGAPPRAVPAGTSRLRRGGLGASPQTHSASALLVFSHVIMAKP